ncbi:MAG: sel1 repeat family protein, partial [Rhodospirillales bacterium]|nr:sel1 repeat family protein [Rhodospirillales bacterium]
EDKRQAAYWYRKAADQENLGALYNLGNLYFHGEGVSKDKLKGIGLAEKAAIKGHVSALAFLGAVYVKGSAPGGRDAVKAWMYLDMAYRLGDKELAVVLGILEPKMRPEEIERAKRQQAQWLKETGLSVPPRK